MAQGQQGQQQAQPSSMLPGEQGAPGGGMPDLSQFGIDPAKFAAADLKTRGELVNKVYQSARQEFGEEYARRIKLYFEQLAAGTKK
jgi:hypothetical protein